MSRSNKRIHSFSDDILGNHDALTLASLIKNKDISQREVIEATIVRANSIQATLNPIEHDHYEQALSETSLHNEGFFGGVPTYFKDLCNVKGLPMHFGTEALASAKPASENDAIVQQILSMGFVNMGTSTMPEFGLTCSTEFPNKADTLNPWNPDYSAGGSSGGAAVLVASGVVPIAHTADGGGSTRIPAAACGLVGLKASRGRILLSKAFEKQLVDISIDGVVTRSVRDTAHFYSQAEHYYKNKNLPEIGQTINPINRSIQIGFLKDISDGIGVDNSIHDAFNKTITHLSDLGHTLKAVNFPVTPQMKEDFRILWALQGFIVKRLGRFLFAKGYNPKKLTPFTKGLSKIYGSHFWKTRGMIKRLRRTHETYAQFLQEQNIEVLLAPTFAHRIPLIGHLDLRQDTQTILTRMRDWVPHTAYANVAGCPCISLPLAHDEEFDLPIGMQFFGPMGNERLLLELAFQLEQSLPWKKIYE